LAAPSLVPSSALEPVKKPLKRYQALFHHGYVMMTAGSSPGTLGGSKKFDSELVAVVEVVEVIGGCCVTPYVCGLLELNKALRSSPSLYMWAARVGERASEEAGP